MKVKSSLLFLLVISLVLLALPVQAQSQGSQHAVVVIPDSTVEHPEDVGVRAHTNHLILVRPDFTGTAPAGETPQSIDPV